MFDPNKIEDLQYSTEKQIMDSKSARIRAVDLAVPIVSAVGVYALRHVEEQELGQGGCIMGGDHTGYHSRYHTGSGKTS